MSHNRRRPRGLDAEATAQIAATITRERRAQSVPWRDLADLAAGIAEHAREGRNVRLTPATASIVAAQLEVAAAKPTRDEVASMICSRGQAARCETPCYECRGRANIVVRAYGCRLEEPRPGSARAKVGAK